MLGTQMSYMLGAHSLIKLSLASIHFMVHYQLKFMSGKEDEYEKLLQSIQKDRIEAPETESARSRKWKILKRKAAEVQIMAKQGFIMGGLVGSGFGLVSGIWAAWTYGKISMIPITMVVSGASFGFIMACGSVIRSDDELQYDRYFELNGRQTRVEEFWRMKYMI